MFNIFPASSSFVCQSPTVKVNSTVIAAKSTLINLQQVHLPQKNEKCLSLGCKINIIFPGRKVPILSNFIPESDIIILLRKGDCSQVRMGRNDNCWCGSGKKYKKCHEAFDEKIASYRRQGHIVPSRKIIKTPRQVEEIRESAKINIAVLDAVAEHIREGMTTEDIDRLVYDKTKALGAMPAQLGYEGFPKSVCTSINEEVCHGIPSKDRILKNGDIINVDASTILNGYFSDSSRMFCIGDVDGEKEKLVRVVRECVELGLEEVKPWGFLGDMGQAVHEHALKNGYSIVKKTALGSI